MDGAISFRKDELLGWVVEGPEAKIVEGEIAWVTMKTGTTKPVVVEKILTRNTYGTVTYARAAFHQVPEWRKIEGEWWIVGPEEEIVAREQVKVFSKKREKVSETDVIPETAVEHEYGLWKVKPCEREKGRKNTKRS